MCITINREDCQVTGSLSFYIRDIRKRLDAETSHHRRYLLAKSDYFAANSVRSSISRFVTNTSIFWSHRTVCTPAARRGNVAMLLCFCVCRSRNNIRLSAVINRARLP